MYRDINININIVNVVLALYKTEEEVQECIVIKLYLMNKRMKKKESKGNDKMKDTLDSILPFSTTFQIRCKS